jgi:hypothetical protein
MRHSCSNLLRWADLTQNLFTKHPTDVGETYGEHLVHAGSSGIKLMVAGAACLVHAVLPFLFVNTASNTVRSMHAGITKRVDAPNWERHPII